MNDIDHTNIRRLDMTVLVVFLELMRRRKLTAVAAHLGLTQSAISHGLKRLREAFDDELFFRKPQGVEPSAKAKALAPLIERAVASVEAALHWDQDFDPAKVERVLRLGMTDQGVLLLATPLIEAIRREAPRVRLSFAAAVREQALEMVANNGLDLAIGFFWKTPPGFEVVPLVTDGYRVVARRKHPVLSGRLTLARYLRCEHMLVSLSGDLTGIVDRTLADLGHTRNVVASVPYFLPALAVVRETDLIATVPRSIAENNAATFRLSLFEPPIDLRSFTISAVRHRRSKGDQLINWFVAGPLKSAVGQL
jgi:DNA-binding transcriptional LysR family regulator